MQQAQSLAGPLSCGVIRETPVEKCFVFLNNVLLWRNELSAVNLGRFNENPIAPYQIKISLINFKSSKFHFAVERVKALKFPYSKQKKAPY